MDLSIVITSYNTCDLLRDCLESIYKQTKNLKFEVIVVDNGSKDKSLIMISNNFPQIKVIKNKENFGFAKANNQGIKTAKGRWIMLLNSDTKVRSNAFGRLVNYADSNPKAGIIGPKLLDGNDRPQPSTARFLTLINAIIWIFTGDIFLYSSPKKEKSVNWVSGACFMIKKEVIDKIGLLDEHFFMYVEEMEYCYRAYRKNITTWFYPEVCVYHLVRGSSSEGKEKAIWWIYEGLVYFYKKHFAYWKLIVIKLCLRIKAALAWTWGRLTNNEYLLKTYGKAFKMVG